ncbi:MAG: hypothetical protein ACP5NW_04160 [Candidatus Woesearchaeota archaeon]
MVMKDTYDYDQKAQVRDELRDFISRHYPKLYDRKNLKVLTFLGHEDHELRQIWDPLGIPRKNITALEKNSKVYEILAQKDLGVNLVKGSIEDFVLETDDTFNIINLDYQSYFSMDVRETLMTIAFNGILSKKGVFATWLSGKRENSLSSTLYRANLFDRFMKDDLSKDEIFGDRSNIISSEILTAFRNGRTNYEYHSLIDALNILDEYVAYLKNSEGFKEYSQSFSKILNSGLKDNHVMNVLQKYRSNQLEAFRNIRASALKMEPISKDDILKFAENMHTLEGSLFVHNLLHDYVEEQTCSVIDPKTMSKILEDKGLSNLESELKNSCEYTNKVLVGLLYYQDIGSYFSLDTKRFKYIGDNKTPMYVDFNLFSQENLASIVRPNIVSDGNKKKIYIAGIDRWGKNHDKIHDFINYMLKCHNPGEYCGERIEVAARPKIEIYTGSPVSVKAVEHIGEIVGVDGSLSEINSLIAQGKSAREIHDLFPKYSVMQLAGMKAAYSRRENAKDTVPMVGISGGTEFVNSDSSDSDLSKDEAIFLLKSGCTPKEIAETYTAFTKGQLIAFKAHATMGRY